MPGDARVGIAARVPYLGESGVEVDEDLQPRSREQRLAPQVAADVDEQVGALDEREKLGEREAERLWALTADQSRRALEAELTNDPLEERCVERLLESGGPAFGVDAGLRRDLLDEVNGVTEPSESERPVQAHPALAPVEWLVGDCARDHDRHRLV